MNDVLREQVGRVRQWYNLVADAFVARYSGDTGWYLEHFEESLLYSMADPTRREVLDLGTGAGRLLPKLASCARRVTAVDISESLLARAPQLARCRLAQMNAAELGFTDGSFDLVICLGLFEYVSDMAPFLSEIRRVLRPGGSVAFTYHQLARYRHLEPEPADSPYFGRTVGERSRYWTRQRHRHADVIAALDAAGFEAPRSRRLFFRASTRLEWSSRRFGDRSIARLALRKLSLATEIVLGRVLHPVTRWSTGNVLMVARRGASEGV